MTGEVVAREPVQLRRGFYRARFAIRLPDGTRVHAVTRGGLLNDVPAEVRFHYSGDPDREVFLIDHEEDPLWIVLFSWGAAAVLALAAWYAARPPPDESPAPAPA